MEAAAAMRADTSAVRAVSVLWALWQWSKVQLRAYRDVAPLAGLAFAWWRRYAAERQLREGHFMEQCTFLMVNVEGLRKDVATRVSVPTLFSRTLRELTFHNAQMAKIINEAAARTTKRWPFLSLRSEGWLVMANINAHILEVCSSWGHAAAFCGQEVEIVEVIYALVNDRTTTSRRQLRVYLVPASQLRALPPEDELDLRRGSRRSAYTILQKMAALYTPPPTDEHTLADNGVTSGLSSGMGRTWLVVPKAAGAAACSASAPSPVGAGLAIQSAL